MRPRKPYFGKPLTSLSALDELTGRYGTLKALELFKKALLVERLGWWTLRQRVSRQTLKRYHDELLASGLLTSAFEESLPIDDLIDQTRD